MKKRINLTVDAEVYDQLKELPRSVSVSEVVTWILKLMLEDIKRGRELTHEETLELLRSTAEGRDYQERFEERFGPSIRKALKVLSWPKKPEK